MMDFKTIFKDLFIYKENDKKYNFVLPESQNISQGDDMRAGMEARPYSNQHQ